MTAGGAGDMLPPNWVNTMGSLWFQDLCHPSQLGRRAILLNALTGLTRPERAFLFLVCGPSTFEGRGKGNEASICPRASI